MIRWRSGWPSPDHE